MSDEEDRRAAQRLEGLVLVRFDAEGRHGVTRDVSEKGLRIATRSKFSVGDTIELTIYCTSGEVQVSGRVVRVQETPRTEEWRYHIGVELSEPLRPEVITDGARAATRLVGRASSPPPPSR